MSLKVIRHLNFVNNLWTSSIRDLVDTAVSVPLTDEESLSIASLLQKQSASSKQTRGHFS